MQEEIVLRVTDAKLNNARVRNLLDPVCKNVLQRQNPYKIVFKDISKFDAQNPSEKKQSEIEGGKLTNNSIKKLLESVSLVKDLEMQQRLENLKASK